MANPGNYPVYSSQTTGDGILGNINSYDFDTECLTWTTDGIHAGTVFVRNGKFSMTTHCGALNLKKEFQDVINVPYIYHHLRNNLKKFAVGEQNKRVTVDIMKTVNVPIPFSLNKIDLSKQIDVAKKYNKIEEIKTSIINQVSQIINIDPVVHREL